VTFAQTWDVGYDTEEQAAPRRLTTSSSPRLAPQCSSSLSQMPQYPPDVQAEATRETELACGPEAAKAARDFTHTTMADWQLDELIHEAILIASELVTNAIRHGQCLAVDGADSARVALAWQRHAGRVICTVTDRNPRPPVLGSPDRDAESGRGLQVVQALAATWGWIMLGATSKAVWAALTIPR
jgi:anti-sigma regulatory factor (Ser/Thr protein kinase)